jgi:hypothetical protein
MESQGCITQVVSGEATRLFNDGIQKLVKCWQKCTDVGRDYVEK